MTPHRIAGSVMRQKVCHPLAPRVEAASSWSVPTSRRTGTTSRTTKGRHTKMVARIIPGSAKMTWMPASDAYWPSQSFGPQTRMMQRPTTTGDRASGRSMSALTKERAGTRRRTRMRAARTPKIVFSGTTMTVMSTVSHSACTACGAGDRRPDRPKPCSKAR